MEKMSKRREDLEAIRASAEAGGEVMDKALKDGEKSLLEQGVMLRDSLAEREGRQHELREQMGTKGTMLGYHQQMGMAKGTGDAAKTAGKAWGRLRMRNALGLFK